MIVTAVPPERVHEVWPKAGPLLNRAIVLTPEKATQGDIFEKCSTGKAILWLVIDGKEVIAAAVTQLVTYPRMSSLSIVYVGGTRLLEWRDIFLEKMESYARDCGCSAMEGYGRDAWFRRLRSRGWGKAYVMYEKMLSPKKKETPDVE